MAAIDNGAKLRATALTAIDKACMGEDFGFDATVSLAQSPTGVVPVYTVVLTKRSPLLGQGPLVHVTTIPSPQPTDQQVEHAVTEAMKGLRELSTKLLTDGQQPGAPKVLDALRIG